MTFEHANKVIKSLTYKQGVEISIVEEKGKYHSTFLHIKASTIDADPDEKGTPIVIYSSHRVCLEDIYTDHMLLEGVRNAIRKFELHESDEWLRVEGRLFVNPHGNL